MSHPRYNNASLELAKRVGKPRVYLQFAKLVTDLNNLFVVEAG